MAERCSTCKWYRPHDDNNKTIGYCFLKPPVIVTLPQVVPGIKSAMQPEVTIQPASVRPLVRESDVCAEWKVAVSH